MRALLDTCVLSELRQPQCHPRVRATVEALNDDDLFVSVLSVGEIAKGISLLAEGARRCELSRWMERLEQEFGGRILPVDLETGRIWGELTAAAQKTGRAIPAADGLIAATARRHGLRVFTRNADDFLATGAAVLDPWGTA